MTIKRMTLHVALLSLALGAPLAPASAAPRGAVPDFDVKTSCREAERFAVQGRDKDLGYKGCIQDEQNARNELVQRWGSFRGEYRTNCVEQARKPSPSYVEVLTCLEMYSDGITGPKRAADKKPVDKNMVRPSDAQPSVAK